MLLAPTTPTIRTNDANNPHRRRPEYTPQHTPQHTSQHTPQSKVLTKGNRVPVKVVTSLDNGRKWRVRAGRTLELLR